MAPHAAIFATLLGAAAAQPFRCESYGHLIDLTDCRASIAALSRYRELTVGQTLTHLADIGCYENDREQLFRRQRSCGMCHYCEGAERAGGAGGRDAALHPARPVPLFRTVCAG